MYFRESLFAIYFSLLQKSTCRDFKLAWAMSSIRLRCVYCILFGSANDHLRSAVDVWCFNVNPELSTDTTVI